MNTREKEIDRMKEELREISGEEDRRYEKGK